MRERDLKALEFDKIVALVRGMAVSEPGRRAVEQIRPSTDAGEVRERLRATAELTELRSHSGSLPLEDFEDQREILLAAAPEGAVLNGEPLLKVRNFVLAARTAAAFLRSRVESFPRVAAIVQSLVAPKELPDALIAPLPAHPAPAPDASPPLHSPRPRPPADP